MMKLTLKEVENVAGLARLSLAEDEKERFRHQLSSILSHMAQLNEVETGTVGPTPLPVVEANVLREDDVRPSLSQEEALHNAPESHRGLFKFETITSS